LTPQEWLQIAATIQARWPNVELPVATLEQWGNDLADLPADQVAATVDVLYREGREFAPNAGIVRKRLVELLLDPPEWGEVLEQLRAIDRTPEAKATGEVIENENGADIGIVIRPRDDVVARTHPMVVAFREHLATSIEPGLSPDDGSSEARLREKWVGFQRVATRRGSFEGIEAAGLPALERATNRRSLRSASDVFSEVRNQIARPALPAGDAEDAA
jgi:hypothetical protein